MAAYCLSPPRIPSSRSRNHESNTGSAARRNAAIQSFVDSLFSDDEDSDDEDENETQSDRNTPSVGDDTPIGLESNAASTTRNSETQSSIGGLFIDQDENEPQSDRSTQDVGSAPSNLETNAKSITDGDGEHDSGREGSQGILRSSKTPELGEMPRDNAARGSYSALEKQGSSDGASPNMVSTLNPDSEVQAHFNPIPDPDPFMAALIRKGFDPRAPSPGRSEDPFDTPQPPNATDVAAGMPPPPPSASGALARTYEVVLWDTKVKKQEDNPKVDVWLVKTEVHLKGVKAWVRNGSPLLAELCRLYDKKVLLEIVDTAWKGGFRSGRALIKTHVPITPSRPSGGYLYRVIHDGNDKIDGTAHQGLKARGFGLLKTDPLCFQRMVQWHLEWPTCAKKSPFLSATDNMSALGKLCAKFRDRGCRNIRALVINTNAEEWDYDRQTMWSLGHLARELKLRYRGRFSDAGSEYLIENSIPPEAVEGVLSLKQIAKKVSDDFQLSVSDETLEERWIEGLWRRSDYLKSWKVKRGLEKKPEEEGTRKRARGFGKTVVIGSRPGA